MSTAVSLREQLNGFSAIRERFVSLMDENTFNKESSFALQQIMGNAQLQKCTANSLMAAVLNVANIGLTLNPAMKLAYLIPRYDRATGGMVACLEPSYQGLSKLMTDTGSVRNIIANVVYENDEFDLIYGTEQKLIHRPKFLSKEIQLVYSVATLHDGSQQIEVVDSIDLNLIMESSETYKAFKEGKIKSCTWNDWKPEMARKTAIKRIYKYLPKTERWNKIAEAIQIDNEDYDGIISDAQKWMLMQGLEDTNRWPHIDDRQLDSIKLLVHHGMKKSEFAKLYASLEEGNGVPKDLLP